jgi:Dynamin family
VVGKQSAGKSSIVEAFLGFPFNYVVAGEIGTRRPLFLRLLRDKSAILPQWTDLDSTASLPLTTQQVRARLEAANQQARNKPGGVESTPLRLVANRALGKLFNHPSYQCIHYRFEVKYKDCVPISFTDMPGLRYYSFAFSAPLSPSHIP